MFIQTASKTASLFASLAVLASPLAAHALQPLPANAPLPATLPGLVSRRIQMDLASRLNVPVQNIVIEQATPQTWSDACLGLASPDESCAAGINKGWQVKVESSQQVWTYRTNRTATRLRLEPLPYSTELNQADFSSRLSQTLLKTVAQQVQQPVANLQILQVQSAVWDGCLGIASPDTACTAAAIPGFKVIVTNEAKDKIGRLQYPGWPDTRTFDKEWVYHLSADGTQVVQNTLASDLQGWVSSWLDVPENNFTPLDTLDSTVVFQMIVNSNNGIRTVTLTADGSLTTTERLFDLPGGEIGSETASIPLERVALFRDILQQQRFSDFDRMSYDSENPDIAIHGSVTYRTPDASVRQAADGLPAGLQAVMEGWSQVLSPY